MPCGGGGTVDELGALRPEGTPLPGRVASPPFQHPSVSGLAGSSQANHRMCAKCPWAPPAHSPVPTGEAQRGGSEGGLPPGPSSSGKGATPRRWPRFWLLEPGGGGFPFLPMAPRICCLRCVLLHVLSGEVEASALPPRPPGHSGRGSRQGPAPPARRGRQLPGSAAETSGLPPTPPARSRHDAACSTQARRREGVFSKRKEHILLRIYLPR